MNPNEYVRGRLILNAQESTKYVAEGGVLARDLAQRCNISQAEAQVVLDKEAALLVLFLNTHYHRH